MTHFGPVNDAILRRLEEFARLEFLQDILPFWSGKAPDVKNGGFIGRITMENRPDYKADKGLVLNARILWTFSAASRLFGLEETSSLATAAYNYLQRYFADVEYGGYYWLLNADSTPSNTKKQVYAQAFVLYALSEYYRISGKKEVLESAIDLFQLMENTSFDREKNGYFEAFARDWGPIGDLRLSELDMNEKKTMNTHLHVIEAYANLYRVWQDPVLLERLVNLLFVFEKWIIDPEDHHFRLFFDENWQSKSEVISYGHDIEGSWLLHEAALVSGDQNLIHRFGELAVKMATATLPAITSLGGLCHETERSHPNNQGELEWWAQAEAVVGYLNAWELSGENEFLKQAGSIAEFISQYFVDTKGGEWFYRLSPQGEPLMEYDKLGVWKCPYHNSRMCFEILERTAHLLKQ